jgi:hypothetical protein
LVVAYKKPTIENDIYTAQVLDSDFPFYTENDKKLYSIDFAFYTENDKKLYSNIKRNLSIMFCSMYIFFIRNPFNFLIILIGKQQQNRVNIPIMYSEYVMYVLSVTLIGDFKHVEIAYWKTDS